MLQNFDNQFYKPTRAEWMGLLARSPLDVLEKEFESIAHTPTVWLRKPETGLVMVRGKVGGDGDAFNVGETTITRCTLRTNIPETGTQYAGVSYSLGRSHRKAFLCALVDALLQHPEFSSALEQSLSVLQRLQLARAQEVMQQSQSTKVEFFTVAREADNTTEDEDLV